VNLIDSIIAGTGQEDPSDQRALSAIDILDERRGRKAVLSPATEDGELAQSNDEAIATEVDTADPFPFQLLQVLFPEIRHHKQRPVAIRELSQLEPVEAIAEGPGGWRGFTFHGKPGRVLAPGHLDRSIERAISVGGQQANRKRG
jgi:hypothetical protein